MTLELASIPIAALAGVLGILSPCVWPLVPVVVTSTSEGDWLGPVRLAFGLSLSFAIAGTIVSFLFVQNGIDPELMRTVAGLLLIVVAASLLAARAADAFSTWGSGVLASLPWASTEKAQSWGPFAVGLLLGFVWLPCVGPTLGAAIGLASIGQELGLAFVTMLAYGLGTGGALLSAGLVSRRLLVRARPSLMSGAGWAKRALGVTLGIVGILVLTGLDKTLERMGVGIVPDWVLTL